jgi:tRNA dimethylallyltransferase
VQALISPDFKGLIFVGGPTASGKTDFAIQLAQHFNTVILSADSRQLYKELNIGTAKPSKNDLQKVQHYFISCLPISENYSVAAYLNDAQKTIAGLSFKHPIIVVCGGTGLYLSALKSGINQLPATNPTLREMLQIEFNRDGIEVLKNKLLALDQEAGIRVDLNNPRRVIRAIELVMETGLPLKKIFEKKPETPAYKIISFCLDLPRAMLYERINQRVDAMLAQGLEQEAKNFIDWKNHQALQTVGYREWWDYFDGKSDKETTVEAIKQNTRNYAKRQLTWFRKDPENIWLSPHAGHEAIQIIQQEMFEKK